MTFRYFFLQYEPGHGIQFRRLLYAWKEDALAKIPEHPGEIFRMSSSADVEDTGAGRIRVEMSDAGYANFIEFARNLEWKVREENDRGIAVTVFSPNA